MLSAFPPTPLLDGGAGGIDETAYVALVARLAGDEVARVDSITVLGSTGGYAYLDRSERRRAVELAVQAATSAANAVPVLAGIGALRTRDVLRHLDDAQAAGVGGVLLAPVSYQPLTEDEVHDLFAEVAAAASVPVVVYDNPGTTGFAFTDALHARIAALPGVTGIKIPPVEGDVEAVARRVTALRSLLPGDVQIGTSGDAAAATALLAGCDGWWSVLAGLAPRPCRELHDAAVAGDVETTARLTERLAPTWRLFAAHGSFRVVAALAEELGLVGPDSLPRPVRGLPSAARAAVAVAARALEEEPGRTSSRNRT